jgi:hypothetical protein
MTKCLAAFLLCAAVFLAGCSKEPKPRSINEFLDNPIVLEAALVRCAENRSESRYDAECVNARQANSLAEAREERVQAKHLEAESEAKRRALRETQEAAAEAQRQAEEEERRRREAEYLAQFGELPPPEDAIAAPDPSAANAPAAVLSEPETNETSDSGATQPSTAPAGSPPPAIDDGPESDR